MGLLQIVFELNELFTKLFDLALLSLALVIVADRQLLEFHDLLVFAALAVRRFFVLCFRSCEELKTVTNEETVRLRIARHDSERRTAFRRNVSRR